MELTHIIRILSSARAYITVESESLCHEFDFFFGKVRAQEVHDYLKLSHTSIAG